MWCLNIFELKDFTVTIFDIKNLSLKKFVLDSLNLKPYGWKFSFQKFEFKKDVIILEFAKPFYLPCRQQRGCSINHKRIESDEEMLLCRIRQTWSARRHPTCFAKISERSLQTQRLPSINVCRFPRCKSGHAPSAALGASRCMTAHPCPRKQWNATPAAFCASQCMAAHTCSAQRLKSLS